MRNLSMTLLLALLVACGHSDSFADEASPAAAPELNSPPELIVDVDVNDEVWLRDHNMTEKDIRDLVGQLRQNGCQTLIIRCGCMGILPYRTELSYPASFDAEHARANPAPGVIPDMEAYIAERTPWMTKYAEVIRDINPVEVFIRAGHEQGLKVIAWIDLFDDGNPGYRSKFLDEHPHCRWVGKDGKTYFHGLMDYSWPEARAFRVTQATELLNLGADGIHCSTSSHCRHLPNSHEVDFYGYSQPIVDAFQTKYGVDIRTATDFDKAAWHDLKGDAMVQLYKDLADLCHERGKELWVGLQIGRYTQLTVDPHFSSHAVVRYTNHWKALVDQRIADAFILGDYEAMSGPDMDYWQVKKDIQRQNGEDLYSWAAREYKPHCAGRTQLYLFSEWISHVPTELEQQISTLIDHTQEYGFDGIDMHEAWNFQTNPSNMAILKSASLRLQKQSAGNDVLRNPLLPPGPGNVRNSEGDFIQLADGRILFVYSHFTTSGSADDGAAHLAGSYSSDGGETWTSEDVIVVPNEGRQNIMSVSLLRLADGRIALFYARKHSLTDCRPVMRISTDEAETWSEPTLCISDDDIGYYVLNNDRAVQLKNGRILLPLALHNRPDWKEPDWDGHILCLLSDDGGRTWRRSKDERKTNTADGKRVTTQEPGLMELNDGRVFIYCRTNAGSQYVSYSSDGGDTWPPLTPSKMRSPCSPATIKRIPRTGDLILVWNDYSDSALQGDGPRTPLRVAVSRDEGLNWEHVKTLEGDPNGHFCYTAVEFVGPNILLGYCAGGADQPLVLTQLTRFSLDWLYK